MKSASGPERSVFGDDAHLRQYVLHQRALRPGQVLEHTARFYDDDWPLAPASLQSQARGLTLRFTTVPSTHRVVLKRLCYKLLSGPLPDDEERPRVSSIVTTFYNLRLFLVWLDVHHPSTTTRDLTREILDSYQRHLLLTHSSSARRFALRSAVNMLWRYHTDDVDARLDPRRNPVWTEPDTAVGRENRTERIPEAVHSRVLVWALRFIDDFSDDILGAIEAWRTRRRPVRTGPATGKPHGYQQSRIRDYLAAARSTAQPLPGRLGMPHFNAIAYIIGCDRTALERQREDVIQTAIAVGVSEYAELAMDIRGRIDGRPWVKGISLTPGRDDSLTVLTRMLQISCYIVIAFLSGMRDNEIKHLRPGCCTTAYDVSGRAYRWTVTSLAFKGEVDEHGVTATWVVGAAAARAIRVLESAHASLPGPPSQWLFAPLKVGPGAGSAGRGGNHALTLAATNQQLARFTTWVNTYCIQQDRTDCIPDVNGRPWRLSTRQFRRTLAWYIARLPGGSIAGAIAYRHHSIQMFEGYAGTSDSGFRAEVEAEQALARGEELLAMVDQHDHTHLLGPAADTAEIRLEAFMERTQFQGIVATDRHRLLRLLSRDDPAVYPDRYVTCVYDHRKALCRERSSVPQEKPNLADCKPLTCANVALSETNRTEWEAELGTIDADINARPALPPLLLARLQQRRTQIVKLLQRHEEAVTP